jgi:hypothetical protein
VIDQFENSSIIIKNNDTTSTRKQIQELYNVPRKTLSDNIDKLKYDKLITGRKSAVSMNDGTFRTMETFNLDEIIAIGLRLRSDRAIIFQRWAIGVLKSQIVDMKYKFEMQQMQLDYYEDKEDINKLYNR